MASIRSCTAADAHIIGKFEAMNCAEVDEEMKDVPIDGMIQAAKECFVHQEKKLFYNYIVDMETNEPVSGGGGFFNITPYFGVIGELQAYYTVVEHRRKGYGEMLVKHALKGVKQSGATMCVLNVHCQNFKAKALYHKLGFHPAYNNLVRGYSKSQFGSLTLKEFDDGIDAISLEFHSNLEKNLEKHGICLKEVCDSYEIVWSDSTSPEKFRSLVQTLILNETTNILDSSAQLKKEYLDNCLERIDSNDPIILGIILSDGEPIALAYFNYNFHFVIGRPFLRLQGLNVLPRCVPEWRRLLIILESATFTYLAPRLHIAASRIDISIFTELHDEISKFSNELLGIFTSIYELWAIELK